jgi:cellulose biosynthesis protein BcsS
MRLAMRLGIFASIVLAAAFAGGEARATDWYTGANPPPPDESWIVTVDPSVSITSNSSRFEGVTVTMAATDTLKESGARIRLEGLEGVYDYKASATQARVQGHQVEGSLLAGYEWIWRNATLSGYVGLNVRDNRLSVYDPQNKVVGTAVGVKSVLEFYANPTDDTMVSAYGSYATDHRAYYTRFKVGLSLFDRTFVGPEAMFLGDDFFSQWRVGAHVTGFRLGALQFGLSGGYVRDRVQKGGAYTTIDVRAAF